MDSNNHIHKFESTVVAPTCKENGYTLHRCECGYEHKSNFTPVSSHNLQITEETAPTCTEAGKKVGRCTVCGEEKSEIISPLGHNWENWNVQMHPSCTEKGMQMRICARCGLREDQEIAPVGHKLTSPKKSQTQDGYVDYFCENCGETITMPSAAHKRKKSFSKF